MNPKQQRALRLIMEAELSHEDMHDALRKALRALYARAWCWLEAVFDDHVIYQVESKEPPIEATPQVKKLYDVTYTLDASGEVSLGTPVEVKKVVTYEPVTPAAAVEADAGDELDLDFIPLEEKAVDRTGVMRVKIIQPGWGSSGYYPKEVLERDGPKVFTKGLKMFADHPTAAEEAERPERSIKDLVATLVSDAVYDENAQSGPGLYADARVRDTWQPVVEELAPHIGTSIRALGRASRGEAEGKKGPIIQALASARSVDLVTEPGAGGKILNLFESARARAQQTNTTGGGGNVDEKQLQEAEAARDEAQTKLAESETERERLQEENARLKETNVLRDAKTQIEAQLPKELPTMTRERLVERLSQDPPVKDDALDAEALKESIEKAVADEIAYLAKVTESGRVTNLGDSPKPENDSDAAQKLGAAFGSMGLSESAAKIATSGR